MGCGISTSTVTEDDAGSGRITAELKRKLGVQRTATYLASDPNSMEDYKRVLRSAGAESSDDDDDKAPIVLKTSSDSDKGSASSQSSALRGKSLRNTSSPSDAISLLNRSLSGSRRVSIFDPNDAVSNRSGGSIGRDALGRLGSISSLARANSTLFRGNAHDENLRRSASSSFGFDDDPSLPHVPWEATSAGVGGGVSEAAPKAPNGDAEPSTAGSHAVDAPAVTL